jgi:hypothetical protein
MLRIGLTWVLASAKGHGASGYVARQSGPVLLVGARVPCHVFLAWGRRQLVDQPLDRGLTLFTSLSRPSSARRSVRILSGVIAAGALVVGFGLSAGSASADPAAPTNVTAPTITGDAIAGTTVSTDDGTWATTAGPLTYTYLWSDDDNSDLGEDASYDIQSFDIGDTLTVTVTATDTNDNSTDASTTMSSAVVASDIVNTVAPSISGTMTPGSTLTGDKGTWTAPMGETITYTYEWGSSTGRSGGPVDPADVDTMHTITRADFGRYMSFVVTAHAGGQESTASGLTVHRVSAPAPVSSDAGLTAANKGDVTGSQSTNTATVKVAAGVPGDTYLVYGYSAPKSLGFFTLSANRELTVPLTGLTAGLHKLAIVDPSGLFLGWMSVTAGGGLASTGLNANVPLEVGIAGGLVVVGVLLFVFVGRRRNRQSR